MNIYVFGQVAGDLPTHLVGRGEPGSRIRAVTRLEGPDHNVFVAIEAADLADADTHMSVLAEQQVTPGVSLPSCEDPLCLDQILNIFSRISVILVEELIAFILLEIKEALHRLHDVQEALGTDKVAAATDGKGLVAVQITGSDRAELERAIELLASSDGARVLSVHWARADEHHVAR